MLRNSLAVLSLSILFLLTGCGGGGGSTQNNQNTSIDQPTVKTVHKNNHLHEEDDAEVKNSNTSNGAVNKQLKQIDLLILVDKDAPNTLNGKTDAKIDHFISVTNKIYLNSTLPVKFNIVKIHPYSFTSKNGEDVLFEVYEDSKISKLKDQVHADLVLMYRKFDDVGLCGIAFVNHTLNKDMGYGNISLECPATTTAHEIGHTMGLTHSAAQGTKGGVYKYARGHGVDGVFSTIMAYGSSYNTSLEVLNYSSPKLECEGYSCGVEEGLDDEADAVKALRYSIEHVANFR